MKVSFIILVIVSALAFATNAEDYIGPVDKTCQDLIEQDDCDLYTGCIWFNDAPDPKCRVHDYLPPSGNCKTQKNIFSCNNWDACWWDSGRCNTKGNGFTEYPTISPTMRPTTSPTPKPTASPSTSPTDAPSVSPTTESPSVSPSFAPSASPSVSPSSAPSASPTNPTKEPTNAPTAEPTNAPSSSPTITYTRPVDGVCQDLLVKVECGLFTGCIWFDDVEEPKCRVRDYLPPSGTCFTQKKQHTCINWDRCDWVNDLCLFRENVKTTNAPTVFQTTASPTNSPTPELVIVSTNAPIMSPTRFPTKSPSYAPSVFQTTNSPSSKEPTFEPTSKPTIKPTNKPSESSTVTDAPTVFQTTANPTSEPTGKPTDIYTDRFNIYHGNKANKLVGVLSPIFILNIYILYMFYF